MGENEYINSENESVYSDNGSQHYNNIQYKKNLQCGYTSIVYNNPNKTVGLQPYYYRYRSWNPINTPANQYQKLKLIQNTVRVHGSLYTSNLGPLNAYVKPTAATYGVCWNQMSDRPVASVQKVTVPTGNNNSLNRRHTSVTSSKPGCQTPGGTGCDIKHNSYDRYLNRLKGKGPLRRGVVPPGFGTPVKFNPAYPVYGGKTVKTNIVSGCDCPIGTVAQNYQQDTIIYYNPLNITSPPDSSGNCGFVVGSYVYAIQKGKHYYSRAIIISIVNYVYTIKFDNGIIQTANYDDLLVYFPCNNCNNDDTSYVSTNNNSKYYTSLSDVNNNNCYINV
jgi:hypothetical protein